MDSMTELSISAIWKNKSYNFILVIIDYLIKIVNYKPIKIIIDIPRLVKVIINVVIYYHEIFKSIITD